MDFTAIGKALFLGCFDNFRGLGTFLLMKDQEDVQSPSRNHDSKRKPSERRKQYLTRKERKSLLKSRLIYCTVMSLGIYVSSILLFQWIVLPVVENYILGGDSSSTMSKFKPLLNFIFTSFWVVPLLVLIKCVNCFWFQDIADSAFLCSRGRPVSSQSLSVWIADSIFNIVVQSLFLVQAMLIRYVPICGLGYFFYFIHICLLYSLYAFEYKWFHMGWELNRRLTYIEKNWPYFLGFGIPVAVITEWPNSWILSAGFLSFVFPFLIISANEANPVDNVRVYPLHLFSLVINLPNLVFSSLMKKKTKNVVEKQQRSASRSSLNKSTSSR